MKKIHQESCMSEGRRRKRRTGRNGSRKGRHRERQKDRKTRELRRKGNLDATVKRSAPGASAAFPGLGFVSFCAPDLAVSQLCALPRARARRRPPPPACACLCVCLSLTGEPDEADLGEAQSQDADLPTNALTHVPPRWKVQPIAELLCLEKSGVRVWAGEAEKLFFPLAAPQRSQNPRTSGGGEGKNHTKPQQPPTEWTPVPLA